MKNLLLFFIGLIFLFSCTLNNTQVKKKVFKKEVLLTNVINKVDVKRGDFLVVFYQNEALDTIPVYRYNSLFDKIDTLTLISKSSNSFILNFRNLKRENNIRYDLSIELLYW